MYENYTPFTNLYKKTLYIERARITNKFQEGFDCFYVLPSLTLGLRKILYEIAHHKNNFKENKYLRFRFPG